VTGPDRPTTGRVAGGPPPAAPATAGDAAPEGFELLVEREPPGLLRRFFTTHRHFLGLLFGGLAAHLRELPEDRRRGLSVRSLQVLSLVTRPWIDRRLVGLPFPAQLRRRLEILGPTYIKLGQILSLREDILPRAVTEELKLLLDRLPAVPHRRFVELVSAELGRDAGEVFASIDPVPLGSASIGQVQRARLATGEEVILKLVKPGVRETVRRDVVLLRFLGRLLDLVVGRFQPRRVISEFCHYTLREIDLRIEADNAETFIANFRDEADVVFPRVYRELSTRSLLCLDFLDGIRPDTPQARALPDEEKDRVIDLGASTIIRMLYRDGFFHADLHPGNLLILPGPKAGFIDLGMVGRFDDELRRTLLYYYYCLVSGDAEGAARYLTSLAETGSASDTRGFSRQVAETCHRWYRNPSFETFSLGQLIMESVAEGGRYRVYFPVEMVLMVKAIVTFEGVGHLLRPGFDVAELSRRHIVRVLLHEFSPLHLAREGLRGAPELMGALVKAPLLITHGLRALDQATRRQPENPFSGLRGTLLGGFLLLSATLLAGLDLARLWPVSLALFLSGLFLALRRQS
jgi:ubiquinone biosynthesis protein